VLVTGATGQIGSELVPALRRKYGDANVIASDVVEHRDEGAPEWKSFERIDVTDRSAVVDAVEKHGVDTIYHLAGILSANGEKNPALAWNVNLGGLYNVLEVARGPRPLRVFWPSSIAVFGPEVPNENAPQVSPLIPRTMYGVTKVAGELLCNYYFSRFNVDVRSVRYPGIISSVAPPGGGTTDYAVEMFYYAVRRKVYTCFVRKDTVLPMLYMPDCIDAAIELMVAEPSRISVRTAYNISGPSFSAGELVNEIKMYIPEFECEYRPDFRQSIADSWPRSMDDSHARDDWGWKPEHTLDSMVREMLGDLSKRLK
jgi:nucleoside-diphosphate-sugar epimerase